jgi:hypothetical protein
MQRSEHIRLLRTLGVLPAEDPNEPADTAQVDWDGGARESAPPPEDPIGEHNALALAVIQRANRGGI